MHKARLAELILSMVTSRERASSTVGDWIEEVPTHGIFWFWSCVSRTVLSILWRDFAVEPAYLAGLGFRGFVVSTAFLMAGLLCVVICSVIFGFIGYVIVGAFGLTPDVLASAPIRRALELAGALPVMASQFLVGRWIARRAHGREMAACVAFLFVDTVVLIGIGGALMAHFGHSITVSYPKVRTPDVQISETGTLLIIENWANRISLFGGAVWVRRQLTKTPQL